MWIGPFFLDGFLSGVMVEHIHLFSLYPLLSSGLVLDDRFGRYSGVHRSVCQCLIDMAPCQTTEYTEAARSRWIGKFEILACNTCRAFLSTWYFMDVKHLRMLNQS